MLRCFGTDNLVDFLPQQIDGTGDKLRKGEEVDVHDYIIPALRKDSSCPFISFGSSQIAPSKRLK